MSSLTILGDTSGSVALTAATVAGSTAITIAAQSGTLNVGGPAFSAYKSTDQTGVSNNTATKITFDTENYDTNNNFASSRFTPTVAGYYWIGAQILPAGASLTVEHIAIYKNGSEYANFYTRISANDTCLQNSALVYCNGTTDYIEIYGRITGSSLFFGGGASNCWFNGYLARTA
jgi:hypothetical protein